MEIIIWFCISEILGYFRFYRCCMCWCQPSPKHPILATTPIGSTNYSHPICFTKYEIINVIHFLEIVKYSFLRSAFYSRISSSSNIPTTTTTVPTIPTTTTTIPTIPTTTKYLQTSTNLSNNRSTTTTTTTTSTTTIPTTTSSNLPR